MKCRVCRGRACLEIRRHNAAFCTEHFLHHCRQQVDRAVHSQGMFTHDDRVLLAVSGGKDSLMLWDVLLKLGYQVDGLYIGLGIGDYSRESVGRCRSFSSERGACLVEVDMVSQYGYDIPTAASVARRATCSTCGLSKRYVMNDVAMKGDYVVLATGHNLDDEAAVLFGNLMHWNMEALARQKPVLDAKSGFVKKVKPLIRLGERETAAYAVLERIDYIVEECPMVADNTGLRYKDVLNVLESKSPGTKHQLYLGYLDRGASYFDDADSAARDVHPCGFCGSPTTAEICAFCRLQRLATDEQPKLDVVCGQAAGDGDDG